MNILKNLRDRIAGASREKRMDNTWENFMKKYNERYTEDERKDMIISENLRLSHEYEKTRRNSNMFVIGGAGSGKAYSVMEPNIMQAHGSMVITDPAGDLFSKYGRFLERNGYNVKCLNLDPDHMAESNHYNPLFYVNDSTDVVLLTESILKNTENSEQSRSTQYWRDSESSLLNSSVSYLVETKPIEDRTFSNLMDLLMQAQAADDPADYLDKMFGTLEHANPASWAASQYKLCKLAGDKNTGSILMTLISRLQPLTDDAVRMLTASDDMELDRIGNEKTALFLCIPMVSRCCNFLASVLYAQILHLCYTYSNNNAQYSQIIVDDQGEIWNTFTGDEKHAEQTRREAETYFNRILLTSFIHYNDDLNLYEIRTEKGELIGWRGTKDMAEDALVHLKRGSVKSNQEQLRHGFCLPVPLTLFMDEIANTGIIPDFPEYFVVSRLYRISMMVLVQSIAQLKVMYPDDWECIAANCDTTLFLGGGADTQTAVWMNKMLGQENCIAYSPGYMKNKDNASGTGKVEREAKGLHESDLRAMAADECLVILKAGIAMFDRKYCASDHSACQVVEGIEPYHDHFGRQVLKREVVRA